MGSILDDDLRRPPRSEWEPTNVGAVKEMRSESSVTLLVERAGRWEYGREIPVQVSLNELACVPLPGRSEALYWSGIQVRMAKQELPDPTRRYYVTAALLPPSFLWNTEAPLLPGISRKDPGWSDGVVKLAAGGARLSELAFDPFEQDPGYLVARLGDLTRPHWAEEQSDEIGEGFLVVRSPNRRSKEPRKWMLGLCPVPPAKVVMALEESTQEYLQSVIEESAPNFPQPRRPHADMPAEVEARLALDWQDREQMGTRQYRVPQHRAEQCLQAAVWQSLARAEGSRRSLRENVQTCFGNLFRDFDGRIQTKEQGARENREQAEVANTEFIRLYPDCDRFRPRGRLDLTLLRGAARHPDPEARRCAELFRQFLRRKTLQRKNTPSA